VDAIIEARKEHPTWGPKKLQVASPRAAPTWRGGREHDRRCAQALWAGSRPSTTSKRPAVLRAPRRVRRAQRRLVRGFQRPLRAARCPLCLQPSRLAHRRSRPQATARSG
jgi:hypothetical protein